ncbi:hypothetical protein DLAC_11239 [Tieghemostelium lacteum]|uniref:Importin subunit alpha n=1 Tax=Tieghemostelium lacteum TaxID=361077 RepID=A0A151Z3M6_TIELA|nr:hypothetical protein DLAC_11239 [Tieghemostelium lacteum]|eukprot:KYQ88517.1 hypothetical protein DLAC_11239 [Tieghemostelium lacteum]
MQDIQDVSLFPTILTNINSTNPDLVTDAVRSVRKLLSAEHNPPIDLVIRSGLVQKLHYLLQFGTPTQAYESSWALTNIASGTSEHTKFVVENGVVHTFIVLLNSPDAQLAEQCLWGVGNIAGDTPALRDYVLSLNITEAILQMVQKSCSQSLLRNIAWTISNMCRGTPPPNFKYIKPLFPVLCKLVTAHVPMTDEQVIDTLWAFSFITENANAFEEEIFKEFQKNGIIERLFVFLSGPNTTQVPAFRTLGNLLSGSDMITETLLQYGILNHLIAFTNHSKEGFVKDAYWCLSNVTSGNVSQIQRVIDSKIFPKIFEASVTGSTAVRTEALWVVINAVAGGSRAQVNYLVSIDLAKCFGLSLEFVLSKTNIQSNFFDALLSVFNKFHGEQLETVCMTFKQHGWDNYFEQLLNAKTSCTNIIEEASDIYYQSKSSKATINGWNFSPASTPPANSDDVNVRLSNLRL